MSNSAEKLVKYTIKLISKSYDLDYEEVKNVTKKVIKNARNYDEQLLGMMEEMLDLGNIGSEEELEEFDIEVLKLYCRIKDLDDSLSDKKIRQNVWNSIQEEFELDSDEEDSDSDNDSEISESEITSLNEPEPEPEPEPVKKKKRSKEVIINA
jgi:hypothetical protein